MYLNSNHSLLRTMASRAMRSPSCGKTADKIPQRFKSKAKKLSVVLRKMYQDSSLHTLNDNKIQKVIDATSRHGITQKLLTTNEEKQTLLAIETWIEIELSPGEIDLSSAAIKKQLEIFLASKFDLEKKKQSDETIGSFLHK